MPAGTVILAGGGETAPEIAQTLARPCANRPIVVLAHTQRAVGEGARRSATFLKQPGQQPDQKPLARGGCTLAPVLGILPTMLVDQHFLKRQRLLRMLGARLEHQHLTGLGIDEDGWAIVHNRTLTVKAGQVVVAQIQGRVKSQEELLGCDSVCLRILLPGEHWRLPTSKTRRQEPRD